MKMLITGCILAAILALGGVLHAYGSFLAYEAGSSALVWSLGSAAFAVFLAILAAYANLADAPMGLVGIIVAGLLVWSGTVAGFGLSIGNIADPRVLYHLVISLALIGQLIWKART